MHYQPAMQKEFLKNKNTHTQRQHTYFLPDFLLDWSLESLSSDSALGCLLLLCSGSEFSSDSSSTELSLLSELWYTEEEITTVYTLV